MNIYKGEAKKLDDIDLPAVGAEIGVGEDVVHALIEVETRGTGFDKHGRVIMLFEPHKFYANLRGANRTLAVGQGLAYPRWGEKKYPLDSYPRLAKAMLIDETAALRSCSWGMGQVMGDNFKMLKFKTVQEMVRAFADDEEKQLQGMIDFIKGANIDDDLRRIEQKTDVGQRVIAQDWVPVVRVYNGAGYFKNNYHNRAAAAYNRWLKIKDTPFGQSLNIKESAAKEEVDHGTAIVEQDETPSVDVAEPAVAGPTVNVEQAQNVTAPPPPVKGGSVGDTPQEVAQTKPSWITRIIGVATGIATPLGAAGIKLGGFQISSAAVIAMCAFGIVGLIVGAWIYNEGQKRAARLTELQLLNRARPQEINVSLQQ